MSSTACIQKVQQQRMTNKLGGIDGQKSSSR